MSGDRTSWLQGGQARCLTPAPVRSEARRFVLLGAPGIGKGTQAELLSEHFGACHLSTGDVFRAAARLPPGARSPAMRTALECMQRGELVPDKTVLEMVRERLRCLRCRGGFLLDGFPRTVPQAEALAGLLESEGVALHAVLTYELPIEQVVSRLGGRRVCASCKAVFHVETRPPRKAGVCDACGGALDQRADDQPEAIRVRMEVYERSTAPLIEFYRKKNLLVSIAAEGTPESIFEKTVEQLNALG